MLCQVDGEEAEAFLSALEALVSRNMQCLDPGAKSAFLHSGPALN